MQTQCPHCETKFRVTKTQLTAADGFVRCGVCQEVFNTIEVANQDKQPLLETDAESTALPADEDITIVEQYSSQSEISDDEKCFNDTANVDEANKDTFEYFNDNKNESHQHLVPEQFRESHTGQPKNLLSTVLWSLATLLLTVTLVIEYTWFNRNQLSQIPELQTAFTKLCQRFECKHLTARNPAKIELVSRNIYTHPNAKNALMVNVTMKNKAKFAQPYPVLQVDFSDIRGSIVSARRFFPAEYMPMQNHAETLHLLAPDTDTTVTLEIQDPGKQAMTYEFNFL